MAAWESPGHRGVAERTEDAWLPDVSASADLTLEQATDTIRSCPGLGLPAVEAVIGAQLQQQVDKHLPYALGYHNGPSVWWSLPVLADAAAALAAPRPAVHRVLP